MHMNKRIECIITGKVQAVGFRYFAFKKAKKLAIFGTVENLEDGSVRVVGEGEEESLKKFVEYLKIGPIWFTPPFTSVKDMNVVWLEASNEFTDFQIIS